MGCKQKYKYTITNDPKKYLNVYIVKCFYVIKGSIKNILLLLFHTILLYFIVKKKKKNETKRNGIRIELISKCHIYFILLGNNIVSVSMKTIRMDRLI